MQIEETKKCQHCGSPLDKPLQIKSTLGAWADYICKPCFTGKLKERIRKN